MTRRAAAEAVLWATATCLVGALCFAGAVTTTGLLIYVLPSVSVAAALTWLVHTSRFGAALMVPVLAYLLGQSVNVASGDAYGPAARSSFAAIVCTGAAVLLVTSRWPSLFLLPVAGLVGSALALGAATEVRLLVLLTVILSLVALAAIERIRRRPVGLPRGLVPLVASAVLVVLVGAVTFAIQTASDDREPYYPFPQSAKGDIKPFGQRASQTPSPSPEPTASPTPSATATPTASTEPTPTATATPTPEATVEPSPTAAPAPVTRTVHRSGLRWLVLFLLLLPILLIVGARVRSLLAWRRLRRRLHRGAPSHAIAGAWVWLVARRTSLGRTFTPGQSPDVLLAQGALEGPWQALAERVTAGVYGGTADPEQASQAWADADEAWALTVAGAARWRRVLAAFRVVPATHRGA